MKALELQHLYPASFQHSCPHYLVCTVDAYSFANLSLCVPFSTLIVQYFGCIYFYAWQNVINYNLFQNESLLFLNLSDMLSVIMPETIGIYLPCSFTTILSFSLILNPYSPKIYLNTIYLPTHVYFQGENALIIQEYSCLHINE